MTTPIDLARARTFLKADGDDDDLITEQLASATTMCQDYCNRVFYVDSAAQEADFTTALVDRTEALTNRKAALGSVTGRENDDDVTRGLINGHYIETLGRITQRINGIVLDDAINAAILITLGHIYRNREDNLATGNNVVQVPVGAQRMLQSKLWIGNLVDGGIGVNSGCWPGEGS